MTDFKVESSLEGGEPTENTDGYVSSRNCRTQNEEDQYFTVWISENIDKVTNTFNVLLFLNTSYCIKSRVTCY